MSQIENLILRLIVEKNTKGETQYYVNKRNKKNVDIKTRLLSNTIYFDAAKAQDGIDVNVEVENGLIKKVTISGQPEMPPKDAKRFPQKNDSHRGGNKKTNDRFPPFSAVSTNEREQGCPKLIGMPFHNPYTFIPFASNQEMPEKRQFTPRTKDERDKDRFSGVMELEITTLSPLMTNGAIPKEDNNGHKTYSALTIGNDIIVPATGIRGFLRNLLTIITGGPLTTIDTGTFLCQGRDLQLGSGKANVRGYKNVYLGRVIEPGNSKHRGKIERGETRLIDLKEFKESKESKISFPYIKSDGSIDRIIWIELDDNKDNSHRHRKQLQNIRSIATAKDERHCWQLKPAGKPVPGKRKRNGSDADKFEGVFKSTGEITEVPSHLWAEYSYRNRHGIKKTLKKGDLIWLEMNESNGEIMSLQWSRWGKRGMSLKQAVPEKVYPDYLQGGEKVSPVSDLFGLVPVSGDTSKQISGKSFAGRIRPDNLVFAEGNSKLKGPFPFAVLSSPHPGCIAFYRNSDNPTQISSDDPLRGYKIYRTATDSDIDNPSAPWKFENQGIFSDNGKIEPNKIQKTNFSAPLLDRNCTGKLRLSVRSLNREELTLLLFVW